ncbi:hypothetical protein BHM03_00014791 [Ensete ventricosum]|nr:hypothetical protein BHM03_00014791 [Ensete ventricosum]
MRKAERYFRSKEGLLFRRSPKISQAFLIFLLCSFLKAEHLAADDTRLPASPKALRFYSSVVHPTSSKDKQEVAGEPRRDVTCNSITTTPSLSNILELWVVLRYYQPLVKGEQMTRSETGESNPIECGVCCAVQNTRGKY